MERAIQLVKHCTRNKATHEPGKQVATQMALLHATRAAAHDDEALAAGDALSDEERELDEDMEDGDRQGQEPAHNLLCDTHPSHDDCRLLGNGKECGVAVAGMSRARLLELVANFIADHRGGVVDGWDQAALAAPGVRMFSHASAQVKDWVLRSKQHTRARKRDSSHMCAPWPRYLKPFQVILFLRVECEGEGARPRLPTLRLAVVHTFPEVRSVPDGHLGQLFAGSKAEVVEDVLLLRGLRKGHKLAYTQCATPPGPYLFVPCLSRTDA